MFHTGYEHSCKVLSQEFADPSRLARVLDHGGPVIAAHSGTCAFFDPQDYYPNFIRTMQQYDNLYGDTSIMASLIRWRSLGRLSRESESIKGRILHGSDYPFTPARLPYQFLGLPYEPIAGVIGRFCSDRQSRQRGPPTATPVRSRIRLP